MDTTVYSTVTDVDDPHLFVDCRWKVDPVGVLHIFRPIDSGRSEMVAAFGRNAWQVAVSSDEVTP